MLNTITNLLWGPGTLALLLGTGLFLTIRMRFLPWQKLWEQSRQPAEKWWITGSCLMECRWV